MTLHMAQPSNPLLVNEDRPQSPMDWSDEAQSRSRAKRSIRWHLCATLQLLFWLLVVSAAVLVVFQWAKVFKSTQTSSTPHIACPLNPDPYHPETLQPGQNTCDCGQTIQEALRRNCVYDTLATAWLPPYCRDDELTAEFDRSGPGPHGEWFYFADEAGRTRLEKSEIAMLGETGGKFWVSRDWHIAHCLFYWQKYHRIRVTGVIMEQRFDNIIHIKHCSHLATKKAPGYFFLIDVPVRMNSSWP